MKTLISNFPQQLADALSIGQQFSFSPDKGTVKNIVISGLGGSGIGGTIVQNYAVSRITVPLLVNKTYRLPSFVNRDSLVIICSYSGDTEETIAALEDALRAEAKIVCITSGGKISRIAAQQGIDCIRIPAGMPPRACLGYSLVQLLFTLRYFEILTDDFIADVSEAITLLEQEAEAIQDRAAELAEDCIGKIPVIYAVDVMEGVAVRWRQQINENAKLLGWERVVPEMNHNELVGWRDNTDRFFVIFLRNESDYQRVQMRFDINYDIIHERTDEVVTVWSKGDGYFQNALYLIHLGDWFSWFLSVKHGVDASEVKVIDYLKGALSDR